MAILSSNLTNIYIFLKVHWNNSTTTQFLYNARNTVVIIKTKEISFNAGKKYSGIKWKLKSDTKIENKIDNWQLSSNVSVWLSETLCFRSDILLDLSGCDCYFSLFHYYQIYVSDIGWLEGLLESLMEYFFAWLILRTISESFALL